MKKIPLIILSATALLLLNSCFLLGPGVRTISGTIYGSTTNLVIGAFPNSFSFNGGGGINNSDEVVSEDSSAIEFSPIAFATITGNTYEITLPEDVYDMGDLIAWVDPNQDRNLDFDDGIGEFAYLPVMTIGSNEYIVEISTFGSAYSFTYNDGTGVVEELLDSYNSDDFDFYID